MVNAKSASAAMGYDLLDQEVSGEKNPEILFGKFGNCVQFIVILPHLISSSTGLMGKL